jgi:hypothetical protein
MRLLVVLAAFGLAIQPASSADGVLARLDAYLADYQPKLSELIADETFVQQVTLPLSHILVPREAVPPGPRQLRRRITSDVAFIALPGDAGWLGIRHVKSVDRRPVEGDSSLATTLQGRQYDAARALLEAGAAHNLGLPRTTNLPNLPLEFLHARNRRRFLSRLDGGERVNGARAIRVVLLERITPTLIQNPNTKADMPSVVRAWIDEQSGALLRGEVRTFISFEAKEPENSLTVDFAYEKTLGLRVPVRMREVFPVEPPRLGTGTAEYSNFRKFQTSARIVPQ